MTKVEYSKALYKVSLFLRGPRVLIRGESSSGKSLIANDLKELGVDARRRSDTQNPYYNIYVFDYTTDNLIYQLKSISNGLIIIDNADVILDSKAITYINNDLNNAYIILGRSVPGLELTPNYIGHIVTEGSDEYRSLYLVYDYSNPRWGCCLKG